MAREKSPAFQFYPMDFLADGNVMAMSLSQRGAYITLLCLCWREGSIPNDPAQLAKILSVPQICMTGMWKLLRQCFTDDGGRLIHPRIERERQKQKFFREIRSAAGRLGGRPKQTESKPKANGKQTESKPKAKKSSSSSSSTTYVRTPLTPLKRGAVRLTRKALDDAKAVRARIHGRCPHDPHCPTYDACIRAIALERLEKAQ